MKNTIIDAGPLIALFNRDDRYHESVLAFLKQYPGSLITTWPVITETTHLLSFNVAVQLDFLEWLARGAVTIVNLEHDHLERIIQLTREYADVPMDLADSSLLVVAEMTGIKNVITLDSDYFIYRTKSKKHLRNILLEYMNKS